MEVVRPGGWDLDGLHCWRRNLWNCRALYAALRVFTAFYWPLERYSCARYGGALKGPYDGKRGWDRGINAHRLGDIYSGGRRGHNGSCGAFCDHRGSGHLFFSEPERLVSEFNELCHASQFDHYCGFGDELFLRFATVT